LLTPTVCASTIIAPTAVSSGAKGARQAQTVVAALVAGDDVLLLEAAVDADVEVLVPPAVLGTLASPDRRWQPLRSQPYHNKAEISH